MQHKLCSKIFVGQNQTEHFEKTETVKRLSCPWCPDDKTCFKSGKSLKFRGHFEDDHEFKCSKCGYLCGVSKVEGHLNTCRGTRLLLVKHDFWKQNPERKLCTRSSFIFLGLNSKLWVMVPHLGLRI